MKQRIQRLKESRLVRVITIAIVVGLCIGVYLIMQVFFGKTFIDNSLIQAPLIAISPQSSGKLTAIDVYEGEVIKKGDPIAVVGGQTIFSETGGLVVMANNQLGSIVSVTNPVAQIIQKSDMRVAGTIDENKGLSTIHLGQVVSFTVDAYPGKTYWGYLDEISSTAKQTQLSFSISSERPTQQFVVYARFDADKYPEIKNGMSAKMTVFTDTK